MCQWKPGASVSNIKKRAEIMAAMRSFFQQRGVTEVETPSLSSHPTIDQHIESFEIHQPTLPARYLITSPEYHMKRLLSAGMGSIYQISQSFRLDEAGDKHNPEFTILEWYRVGWNYNQLMLELSDLLSEILGCDKAERLSYRDLFLKYLDFDPFNQSPEQCREHCRKFNLNPPDSLNNNTSKLDDWLDFFMAMYLEPLLGLEIPVIIYDYPASQASLAKIDPENPTLAQRFELYFKGVELANGYTELTNPIEQETRFYNINLARNNNGLKKLSLDQRLNQALICGLPDCAGVALGVDRLIMLTLGLDTIDEAMAFSWNRC